MKKILILTAFVMGSFVSAQTTTDTTTTTTDTTAAPAMTGTMMAMTPEESFTKAQEYATQADVAYPIPFYDRTLWKAAVDSAYMAAAGDTTNRDYTAYLGQLYTKTQWWINAYNVWTNIGDLTDAEKDWAALSAAKLAYIALNRGDKATAKTYVDQGMMWKSTPSLVAIQSRL
jgi:putative salt-induced outer membrane protein YdiY